MCFAIGKLGTSVFYERQTLVVLSVRVGVGDALGVTLGDEVGVAVGELDADDVGVVVSDVVLVSVAVGTIAYLRSSGTKNN